MFIVYTSSDYCEHRLILIFIYLYSSNYFDLTTLILCWLFFQLLPDLLYTDRMAVHIVHNGPYMLDHSRWNVEEFIERRAEFED